MDYSPIKKLKLKEAFADHSKFRSVRCDEDYLAELFEWSDRGTIFIHDDADAGYSVFITDTKNLGADKMFKVSNPSHRDIFLWHIDGVLYKKDSKCDCALLSDGFIGFVEFKANAANNTDMAITGNYDKAMSQLKMTIKDIADKCGNVDVDLKDVAMVEAYIVFNHTVPRNNAYQKKLMARFLLDTGGIPLYFRNSKEL